MTILLVDDSPVSIRLLSITLKNWGYDFLVAYDGREALEIFKNNDIQIVITDWMMPNMDGLALCEEIRKIAGKNYVYLIVVTSKDQDEDINEAFKKGIDDYITKPLDLSRLKVSLKSAQRITSLSESLNKEIEVHEETSRKLNSILEYSADIIYTLDLDGNFININNVAKELTGYTEKELLNINFYDLFHEENKNKVINMFNSVVKSRKTLKNYPFEIIARDGTKRYFETSVGLEQNEKEITGFQGSIKDITKRVNAEKALEKNEKENRLLIESMKEGLIKLDEKGILTFVNDSFCKMISYSKEELIGKSVLSLFDNEEKEKIMKKMARRKEGIGETYEINYTDKEGRLIPVVISAKPVFNSNGQFEGTIAVITDITAIKQAEHERREIETQLLQSDKMASIGQLAAGVAHEINNPTGFVSSNINTLSDYINKYNTLINEYRNFINQLKQSGNIDDYMKNIQILKDLEEHMDIDFLIDDIPSLIQESIEGTDRIKKIIQDLKDYAHPGDDKPSYADINKCIDSTLNIVWNEIKYKAEVVKEYDNLPEVLCYPQQLNQVFANLFINASHAIMNEGEIKVKTSLLSDKIEVMISDTGSGIPEENINKVFDPFFTTKEVGKGTGLGLNVAYNIVKKHHGDIKVKSKEGKGTSFTIFIPTDNTDESLNTGQ